MKNITKQTIKMKNIIKLASIAVAFTITTSCDDFVEVEPIGPVADNYFNTQEEYEKALIGAYDMLQSTFWSVLTSSIASDDIIAGGDAGNYDQPSLQKVDKMIHTSSDYVQLREIWQLMYAGMNRANFVLEFKDKTEFDGKDELIAEALFLRAYYTFELAKFYGNIPLLTENRNGVKRIKNKRVQFGDQFRANQAASVADVYSLIEEDLKEAIPNLPVNQDIPYEVTKGAAQALLGKVYLYHATYDAEKFSLAAAEFENVITSGKYQLDALDDLWEESGENGPGSVFEVQYTSVEGMDWGCIICSQGTYLPKFNSPRSPYRDPNVKYASGWGFSLPTPGLFNAYDANDQRRDLTIMDVSTTNYTPSREDTGYFTKKYIVHVDNELSRDGADPLNYTNNYRSIRYADVLLMAAEANSQTNNNAKAEGYLNEVRARAFGDNSHDYPYNGEDSLIDAIYEERRLELAAEGHRFFDLVRTGKARAAFDAYNAWANTQEGFESISYQDNKNEVFPIPLVEMELANAEERWAQNPGY